MLRFNVIASGSSGNSYFIETDNSYVFVDVGVSCKRIEKEFDKNSKLKEIYLFITHEHTDHVRGFKTFQKKYNPYVFLTEGTANAMYRNGCDMDKAYIIDSDALYDIDNFKVNPFPIHHDALEPVGYKFLFDNKTIAFATDLGFVDNKVLSNLQGVDTVVLEFNYDDSLIKKSNYPEYLIRRICSVKGHLSNQEALNTVSKLAGSGIKNLFLAHVSENNNKYDILEKYALLIENTYGINSEFLRQNTPVKNIKLI
jgi:phosphoribosyl 1,2-cyclic phosphodiesterase